MSLLSRHCYISLLMVVSVHTVLLNVLLKVHLYRKFPGHYWFFYDDRYEYIQIMLYKIPMLLKKFPLLIFNYNT